jgi:hypothetical protein
VKTYGGVDIQLHAFFTSLLDRDEWSASRFGRLAPPGEYTGTKNVETNNDYLTVLCVLCYNVPQLGSFLGGKVAAPV